MAAGRRPMEYGTRPTGNDRPGELAIVSLCEEDRGLI
jgi:hypothetical protein